MQFREWAALLLCFCIIGIIGLLAFSDFSAHLFSHMLSRNAIGEARPRTAAIVLQGDLGRCQQFTFDNDTGQISGDGRPCDPGVNPNAPGPVGTVRRIDAISKSFSGRDHM